MHAGLPPHRPERVVPVHLEDDLFEAAQRTFGHRDRLPLPPLPLDEPGIHAMQVGCEERRFVAARASANLDDGVTLVEWITRNEQRGEGALDAGDFRVKALLFRA